MILTFGERATLLGMLPKEGNLATLKTLRVLSEKLAFDKEVADGRVVLDAESQILSWKEDPGTEFEFTMPESVMIHKELGALDKKSKLPVGATTLAEKFLT